jgi:hypothetical protein
VKRWRWWRQRRGRAPARKFRGLRGAARSPPLLHAPDAEACGWLAAPRHSGAGGAGACEPSGEDRRRRVRLRLRRGAPCALRGAGLGRLPARSAPCSCPDAARRSQATRSIPPLARRRSDAEEQRSGPGPARGSRAAGQLRLRAQGCMRLARALAKGEGAAGPRRPSRPWTPHPARTPRTFARRSPGAGATNADGARCKFAELSLGGGGRGASAGPPLQASPTAALSPSAQAQARRHTRTHRLAPPQPASRCDRSPATRSKNLP